MTLFGGRRRDERIEYVAVRFRIDPILRDSSPLGPQPLLVDIGILDNERLQPLRVRQDDTKPDWTTIVVKVKRIFVDFKLLKKAVDRLGQVVERIRI